MPKYACRFKGIGIFLIFIIFSICLSSCSDTESAAPKPERIAIKEISSNAYALPEVSAKAAIGIEASSGEIFYSKNIHTRLPMASTTKIMTAIVALEMGEVSDTVEIHKNAVGIEGSSIYLYEGECLTLEDLLYALMLESANDAAVAIAIHIAGDVEGFVGLMNDKAEELELQNTHFENPHGLDSGEHYTTAYDLGIIATYGMKNPDFRKIVSTYKRVIPLANGEGARVLINHNKLIRNYDGAIGIKTGYTKKSGRCLVSAASRDGVELICVTISAPSDWQDHESILDFGNSIYEHKLLSGVREIALPLPVINGHDSEITLKSSVDVSVTVRRGTEITTIIEAPRFVFAPISEGEEIGRVIYLQGGDIIGESPLIAEKSIRQTKNKGFFGIFKK